MIHLFDERSYQGMHDTMLLILRISEAIQIVASYDGPVLFIPIGLCFQVALSLELLIVVIFVVTKSLEWLNCFLSINVILSLIGAKAFRCGHVLRPLIQRINFDCIFVCTSLHAELAHSNTKCFL